ncbi:thiamine pyrophosphate-binding protein [Nocardioides halotolerans]|uniref:thiamine pyrophosphate-binding protein n=1 Tax=Nocardioides halotolerans TaxID=433660 RepID=UPI000409E8A2|nr:thiamine pyrophosphate-binding protein [Nocardioides halotolerans]
MKVYEALAKAFAAEGTKTVFGMMGDANMYWMEELDKLGVELVEARHEGGGLAMADGYGRVHADPGVCTTTSGPGVTQLATTLVVAARARTPLVAFIGEAPAGDPSYVQRLDQSRFAEACEAAFVHVTTPDLAYDAVQKAFYIARTESRPVLISAPMDVQQKPFPDADDEYVPSTELLAPVRPIFPNPEVVEQVADLVAASERIVIVAGRGAERSGAGDEILRLAQDTGALIATTLMTKTWLSEDEFHVGISGNYATRTAIELFQDADLVIALGAGLNKYTTNHGYNYPMAKYVQVDTKHHVVMGDGRSADIFLQADARLAVQELRAALETRGVHHTGYRTPDVKEKLATAWVDDEPYDVEEGTVDPRDVCTTLDEQVPAEIGLVIGGGQNICFSTILMKKKRRSILMNQHFGCIGQGLTTAIGQMFATGKQPTFLMEGDAGFMMHLPEFETAVRSELPLLVIVMNDQLLGAEYHKAVAKGLNAELARISTPDLGEVGRALGGRGSLVRSIAELETAIAEFVADPAPTIVDVRISTQVISIPYRRLHFGQEA